MHTTILGSHVTLTILNIYDICRVQTKEGDETKVDFVSTLIVDTSNEQCKVSVS